MVGISAHRKHSRSRGVAVDRAGERYPGSKIILLNGDGQEKRVITDMAAYGTDIYEIIRIDTMAAQKFPSPLPNSTLESLRTTISKVF